MDEQFVFYDKKVKYCANFNRIKIDYDDNNNKHKINEKQSKRL